MNKIYKVVWSKVKNCYVVVSEIAKNVITGSVKSAKVGSTPMAKGLALGAMMAFVITGNVWAAATNIDLTGDLQHDPIRKYEDGALNANLNDYKLTVNADANSAIWVNGYAYNITGSEKSTLEIVSTASGLGGRGSVEVGTLDISVGYGSAVEAGASTQIKADNINIESNGTGLFLSADSYSAVLDVDFDESLSITGDNVTGIYAVGHNGTVYVNGAKGSTLDIDTDKYAVYAEGIPLSGINSKVYVNTALQTNKNGKTELVYSGGDVTNIKGNIGVGADSEVNVGLKGADSTFTGAVLTAENATSNLILQGANWDVTGDSTVTKLSGSGFNVEGDYVLNLNGPLGNSGTVDVKNLNITTESNGISVYGDMEVTADNITIDGSKTSAIYTEFPSNKDTTASHLTINVGESLEVTGDGHGINSGTSNAGSSIAINGENANISVIVGENAVVTRGGKDGSIEITGKNVTLVSNNTGEQGDAKGHGIYAQGEDSSIVVNASEKLTVTAVAGKNAVKTSSNGKVELNSDKDIIVTGTVQGNFDIDAANGSLTVTATGDKNQYGLYAQSDKAYVQENEVEPQYNEVNVKNLLVYSAGMAINVQGAHLTVNAETVDLKSTAGGGIYVNAYPNGGDRGPGITVEECAGSVTMNVTEALTIDVNGNGVSLASSNPDKKVNIKGTADIDITAGGNGVYTRGNNSLAKDNAINITGKQVKVTSTGTKDSIGDDEGHAVYANGSSINISATDRIELKASELEDRNAIYANQGNYDSEYPDDNQGKVTIGSVDGSNATVVVKGNIVAEDKSEIKVDFATVESILNGSVITGEDAHTALNFDGATWNVTGKSNVSELSGKGAVIAVQEAEAGLVTVGNNTNENLCLKVANGGDLGVDIKTGLEELKHTVVDEAGNALIDKVSDVDNVYLKASVKEEGDKVVTTIKPGDRFVIDSGVVEVADILEVNGEAFVADNLTVDGDVKLASNSKLAFGNQKFGVEDFKQIGINKTNVEALEKATQNITAAEGQTTFATNGKGKITINGIEGNTMLYGTNADGKYTVGINAQTGGIDADSNIRIGATAFNADGIATAYAFEANNAGAVVRGGFTVEGNQAITGGLNVGTDVVANGTSLKATADQVALQGDKITALENASVEQSGKITALEGLTSEHTDKITALENVTGEQGGKITALENLTAEQGNKITALENSDAVQNSKIGALEDLTAEHSNKIGALENLTTEQGNKITALENSDREQSNKITALENATGEQSGKISALEGLTSEHTDKITSLENASAEQGGKISALEGLTSEHTDKITSLENASAEQGGKISALEGLTYEHTDKITALENDSAEQSGKITALENSDAAQNTAIASNADAISGLNQRLGKMNGKINKVGAGAAALAALHPLEYDPDDKLTFSAGVGNYNGENAAALGAFYRPDEKLMFSLGGTMGNGENMVNLGVSIGLDGAKGTPKLSRKELVQIVANMHAEGKEMKAENEAIKAENQALEDRVAKLEALVAKLAAK